MAFVERNRLAVRNSTVVGVITRLYNSALIKKELKEMKFFREMSVRPQVENIDRNVHETLEMTTDRVPAQTGSHLVTLGTVAETLGVSKRYVQILVQRKAIPVIRLGKRCPRFDLSRVLAAVKRFEVSEMTLR